MDNAQEFPSTPRDHVQGRRTPGHARRIWRLRVPALRAGAPGSCELLRQHYGDAAAQFVFRHFPLSQVAPERRGRRRRRRNSPARRPVLGDARRAVREPGAIGLPLLFRPRRPARALGSGIARQRWSREPSRPRCAADFIGGVRSGVNGTPTLLHQRRAARQPLWRCRSGDGDRSGDHCSRRVIGRLSRPTSSFVTSNRKGDGHD